METNQRPDPQVQDIHNILSEICQWRIKQVDRLDSFEDSNFLVRYETTNVSQLNAELQAMVKISHSRNFCQSKIDTERQVMDYLTREGFICTTCLMFPDKTWHHVTDDGKFVIRLFSYIPGVTLKNCLQLVDNRSLLREFGSFVGKLHNSLQGISEKIDVAERPNDPWIFKNYKILYTLVKEIKDSPREKDNLILETVQRFENIVMPSYEELKKGVIHNDIHDLNVIVNYKDGKFQPLGRTAKVEDVRAIYGLIDFNDVAYLPYLFEVAMVIRDLMIDIKAIPHLEVGGHFLSGYTEICHVSEKELQLLPYCIQLGLCQYIVIGESEFQKQPDNEYTRSGADGAWTLLQVLQQSTNATMLQSWDKIMNS